MVQSHHEITGYARNRKFLYKDYFNILKEGVEESQNIMNFQPLDADLPVDVPHSREPLPLLGAIAPRHEVKTSQEIILLLFAMQTGYFLDSLSTLSPRICGYICLSACNRK
jgi:hypothetical protein